MNESTNSAGARSLVVKVTRCHGNASSRFASLFVVIDAVSLLLCVVSVQVEAAPLIYDVISCIVAISGDVIVDIFRHLSNSCRLMLFADQLFALFALEETTLDRQ